MFAIRKWEPFDEISALRREMDDFFRRTFTEGLKTRSTGWCPTVDSFIKEGNVVMRVELPGVDPKDVDISVTGNQLTIKGERKAASDVKGEEYLLCEVCYGAFERVIPLPQGVQSDKVHATYKNGILEIMLPVEKAALPKKVHIEIEGGGKLKRVA